MDIYVLNKLKFKSADIQLASQVQDLHYNIDSF